MRVLLVTVFVAGTFMSIVSATPSQSEPMPGKVPYERVCAACHGQDAKGDQGPQLVPMTLDFDDLLAKVRQGGGEMPAVTKAKMSDEEVKQVFEYLKSL